MYRRRIVFGVVVSLTALGACATGASPLGGGGSAASNDDAGGSAYGGDDAGLVVPEGGLTHPPKDGGTTIPIDSGSSGPPDSGTSGGSFCVGQTSTKRNDFGTKKYDDWCDENATVGVDFTCTDNSQCTGNFTASYEPECCYQPIVGGYCESDYGGGAQCVPQ